MAAVNISYAPINVKPQGGGGAGYPREIDSESFPLGRGFDTSHSPRVGNLTWPPSWKKEPGNESSTILVIPRSHQMQLTSQVK